MKRVDLPFDGVGLTVIGSVSGGDFASLGETLEAKAISDLSLARFVEEWKARPRRCVQCGIARPGTWVPDWNDGGTAYLCNTCEPSP